MKFVDIAFLIVAAAAAYFLYSKSQTDAENAQTASLAQQQALAQAQLISGSGGYLTVPGAGSIGISGITSIIGSLGNLFESNTGT